MRAAHPPAEMTRRLRAPRRWAGGSRRTPLAAAGSAPVAAPVFLDEIYPAYALAEGPVQTIAVPGLTVANNDYTTGT